MSRATMSRHWTAAEDAIAVQVSDAINTAGTLVGTAAVVRAARLPHRKGRMAASVRKVQSVMPRAAELHYRRHGRALIYVPRLRAYMSTLDQNLIIEAVIEARLKKALTVLLRAAAEAQGLDPSSLLGGTVQSHIEASVNALTASVWDAVITDMHSKR